MIIEMTFYGLCLIHLILVIRETLPILKYTQESPEPSKLPITIIIAAHQEIENLKKLIPDLLIHCDQHVEIIVALDRCSDGSIEFLQSFSDPRIIPLNIREVPESWNAKKYALSQAIQKSSHNLLILTDADCKPASPDWIQFYRAQFAMGKNLVLGIGGYEQEPTITSHFTVFETLSTATSYISSAIRGFPYMGVGRNIGYRKSLFEKIGGFDPIKHIMGGDDDLLVQKMIIQGNTGVLIHPHSLTYSAVKRTLKEYIGQKTRHFSVSGHYHTKFRYILTLKAIIHTLLWLSFIYLAITSNSPLTTLGVFGVLMLIKGLLFWRVANKMGLPFPKWFPILDFLMALFLPLLGARASLIKMTKWN